MSENLLTIKDLEALSPNQRAAAIQAGLVDMSGGMMTAGLAAPAMSPAIYPNAEVEAYRKMLRDQQAQRTADIAAAMEAERERNSYFGMLKRYLAEQRGLLSQHFADKTAKDVAWNDPLQYWTPK